MRAGGLDGNRIWRVTTPQGTVLQKYYAERGGPLRAVLKDWLSRLRGGKSSSRAAARRATEARLLQLWRQAGLDVPAELSSAHPDLANADTLVLEDVPGPLLSQALSDPATPPARRQELLRRFAQQWCHRHRLALERGEAALVHEHGTLAHVLVSGDRLVTFDLEHAFLPRADLGPILSKEIASVLRSLARLSGREGAASERFRRDVELLVSAYADTTRLEAAARHYLAHPDAAWRLLWSLERRWDRRRGRGGKYAVLEALSAVLRARAAT